MPSSIVHKRIEMLNILKVSDFQITSCQASIFTPDEEVSVSRLIQELLPKWSDRFDVEPTILPSMEGQPKEIPKLILGSASNEWRCEIGSGRINLFWQKASQKSIPPRLQDFYDNAITLLMEYVSLNSPRIGRMAAVVKWVAFHDQPALHLAQHFCQEKWQVAPLNRPGNFELHAHKEFSLGGKYAVNSWVRNKTAFVNLDQDENQPVVLVEQDINTLAEEETSTKYDDKQMREFFGLAADEFVSILSLYYPEA